MGIKLKDTIEGTCRKAINDGDGNNIPDTYLKKTGDAKDNTVTFETDDNVVTTVHATPEDPSGTIVGYKTADGDGKWHIMHPLDIKDRLSAAFNKLTTLFHNVRYLYELCGTTNIASIGGGTLTGAVSKLNTDLEDFKKVSSYSVTEPEIDSILTVVDTWTLIFFKFGRLVAARANFRAEMEPHDGSYLLGTVPKEFSPLYPVTFIHNTQIYGKRMIVDINMDGSVKVHNLGEKIPRDWVGRWTVTYISQK